MYDFLILFVFSPLHSAFSFYGALAALLILAGIGLPVPEEVSLLLGGYFVYLEITRFWPTVGVLIVAILIGDIMGYLMGRFAGDWTHRNIILRSRFVAAFLEKTKGYFERYGEKMVIFSRPFVGVRVAVPILSGHFRMRFLKFFVYDAIAAIPWTIFLVSLSYYLGSSLDFVTEVREIKHLLFALIGIVIIIFIALRLVKLARPSFEEKFVKAIKYMRE